MGRRPKKGINEDKYCGVILINKPTGMTSHDVVDVVRKKLQIRRVGHGGTLDPLATGLMLILVGKATKMFDELGGMDKTYISTFEMGKKTDSGDSDGNFIEEKEFSKVTKADVLTAAKKLEGDIMQVPPMYSAIRVDGKRLYEYAREGIEVDVPARPVTVFSNEITSFNSPYVEFKAHVSKGTYIRKIAEDMAEEMGTLGYITNLHRTQIGPFDLKQANELDKFDETSIVALEDIRTLIDDWKNTKNNVSY